MSINGHFYAWPDETAAAFDGAMTLDPDTGAYVAAQGWTLRKRSGGLWLKGQAPVLSEPDPETGEQTVVTAGTKSDPVVLIRKTPLADLANKEFVPEGEGGFA